LVFFILRRRKCRPYSSSTSGLGCRRLFCVCVWFGLQAGCGAIIKQIETGSVARIFLVEVAVKTPCKHQQPAAYEKDCFLDSELGLGYWLVVQATTSRMITIVTL
jgi:hypothetical protein